jgi:hypothetical protein
MVWLALATGSLFSALTVRELLAAKDNTGSPTTIAKLRLRLRDLFISGAFKTHNGHRRKP